MCWMIREILVDMQGAAAFFRCRLQSHAVLRRFRHRLFKQHMDARAQQRFSHLAVQAGWNQHVRGIHFAD
jgi:hypothetical protein